MKTTNALSRIFEVGRDEQLKKNLVVNIWLSIPVRFSL